VPVQHVNESGLIHGFFNIHVVPSCARACDDAARAVRARLDGGVA
jgi:hypothetical protein